MTFKWFEICIGNRIWYCICANDTILLVKLVECTGFSEILNWHHNVCTKVSLEKIKAMMVRKGVLK